jgi:uncharacterized protein YecE (DUF72 family)
MVSAGMASVMAATQLTVAGAHVGTSGFAYPSWRGGFYPTGARPDDFLRLYAERLPSVELNVTGYRLPSEEQFERWAGIVPDGFTFAVKMPRHAVRRLDVFEERVRRLGNRLGVVRLVVEGPRDDGLLALLLGSVGADLRLALDLRDPSWDGVDVAPAVRVGDSPPATSFRYLRFRDPPWDEAALERIAENLRPPLAAGVDVFAYFRHEDEPRAPSAALRVLDLLAE